MNLCQLFSVFLSAEVGFSFYFEEVKITFGICPAADFNSAGKPVVMVSVELEVGSVKVRGDIIECPAPIDVQYGITILKVPENERKAFYRYYILAVNAVL